MRSEKKYRVMSLFKENGGLLVQGYFKENCCGAGKKADVAQRFVSEISERKNQI